MRGCDWYGDAVDIAARLAGEARPNEVLVSATTRAAARGELTRRLGACRELVLRGLDRPIAACGLT
jgi:class 3 adenylate cyclase